MTNGTGTAVLMGRGVKTAPLVEHNYEPAETPLVKNPFSGQMQQPRMKVIESDMDKLAKHGDPRFPHCADNLQPYRALVLWLRNAQMLRPC